MQIHTDADKPNGEINRHFYSYKLFSTPAYEKNKKAYPPPFHFYTQPIQCPQVLYTYADTHTHTHTDESWSLAM